jgi:hypothetical protein
LRGIDQSAKLIVLFSLPLQGFEIEGGESEIIISPSPQKLIFEFFLERGNG